MATWNSDGRDVGGSGGYVSGTQSIQYIHDNFAADGDIITFPTTTKAWGTGVTITKGVTISGNTTVNSVAGTFVDNSIIQDNIAARTPLITLTTATGKTYRVTGLTFNTGTATTTSTNGVVVIAGTSDSVRWDNCHFDNMALYSNQVMRTYGSWFGVIDHNVFIFSETLHASNGIFCVMDTWGGKQFGYGSWTEAAYWGTNKFVFCEDNYLKNTNGTGLHGGWDGEQGCRFVVRHNHLYDVSIIPHGDDGGAYTGSRAIEVYNNDFHLASSITPMGIRTGVLISHDNTFDGAFQPAYGLILQNYRFFEPISLLFGADGANPFDYNATESDGTHVDGHPPYLFASGTATSGTNSTTIVATGSPGWTTNQWTGYTAKRVSDGGMSYIESNNANTLTVTNSSSYAATANWTSGDQFEIHKLLIGVHQPGRGAMDLINYVTTTVSGNQTLPTATITVASTTGFSTTGGTMLVGSNRVKHTGVTSSTFTGCAWGSGSIPDGTLIQAEVNTTTTTQTWVHAALEPCFEWSDVYTPNSTTLNTVTGIDNGVILQVNRDYYNRAPQAGDTSIYPYTPYQYPHPLVAGSSTGHGKKGPIIRRRQ